MSAVRETRPPRPGSADLLLQQDCDKEFRLQGRPVTDLIDEVDASLSQLWALRQAFEYEDLPAKSEVAVAIEEMVNAKHLLQERLEEDDNQESSVGNDVGFYKQINEADASVKIEVHGRVVEQEGGFITIEESYALHPLWGYSNGARGTQHRLAHDANYWLEGMKDA